MARFYGEIGFADTVETSPGIAEGVIIEKKFHGDVLRSTGRIVEGDHINPNPTMINSISIVGTHYAFANWKKMRYIKYEGELWEISSMAIQRPRLVIEMGDIYSGPTAGTTGSA